MRVIVSPDADAQLARRKVWWRRHRRKAPELFDSEFADALLQIAQAPESFPVFSTRGGRTVHRCLMPKTRCHLYLEIEQAAGQVWIVAAGGGQRERPPRIKPPPPR